MRNIAIFITDTHHPIEELFDQAFCYALQYNVPIIHGGDFFTKRSSQTLPVLLTFLKIFRKAKHLQIPIYVCPGNHDKEDYTSSDSFLDLYSDYCNLIKEPTTVVINDIAVDFFPFFEDELYLQKMEVFFNQDSKAKILVTHIAINGITNNDGSVVKNKIEPRLFSKYDKVICGHYHNKQKLANVEYPGASLQHNFGEDPYKGIQLLHDNGELIQLETTFDQYVEYIFNIVPETTQAEFNSAINKISLNNDKKVRVTLVGSELDLNRLVIDSSNFDLRKKYSQVFEDTQNSSELSTIDFQKNTSQVIDLFQTFCEQNLISSDLLSIGLQILKKQL